MNEQGWRDRLLQALLVACDKLSTDTLVYTVDLGDWVDATREPKEEPDRRPHP